MATFVVTLKKEAGKNGSGRAVTRTLQIPAPDGKTAMQIAQTQGWSAVQAVPTIETSKKAVKPFPRKPLIVMCNSLAAMLRAQIPLAKALDFYVVRLSKEDLRITLRSISAAVERGDDNHKAFAATGRFDPTFIGLVRAGTMASNLAGAFTALARRMKTNAEFQSKLRKALMMPAGILAFLWLLLIYSMTGLVPKVEKMLKDMRTEPDGFSGLVFGFSHVFQAVYVPVTVVVITFLLACFLNRSFRAAVSKVLLSRWKMLGQIVMGVRQLTFIGVFEMLISNNIPIVDALDTCSRTLKGTPMEKELQVVKEKIGLGVNLGEAIRKYTSFDSQLAHMMEIGEKSSNLSEQLLLLRDLYEEETNQRIELFVGMVGLLSKLVTVMVIGGIYIGTYLPIIMAGPKMMNSGGL